MRRALVIVLLLMAMTAAAATVTATAAAATPRASQAEIEREVMCLVCGTTLNVSESPQADRERAFIRQLIDQGKTKKQIEDALVAQYGQRVLATPPDSGFDLAVWIIPGLAVILAGAGIAFAVVRWRRTRPSRAASPAPAGAGAAPPAEGARLRADLERYDL